MTTNDLGCPTIAFALARLFVIVVTLICIACKTLVLVILVLKCFAVFCALCIYVCYLFNKSSTYLQEGCGRYLQPADSMQGSFVSEQVLVSSCIK